MTTLWDLRENSAEAALLHEKARTANIKPVVAEHRAVLEGLRFATEEKAVEEARNVAASKRPRYHQIAG